MMTHLEIENLASEYLEGGLGQLQQAQVKEHLAACASCRELVEGIRSVIQTCQAAEDVIPPPWLVLKIRRATLGEKQPSLFERLSALPRLFRQPRFVYGIAMMVFSASLIVNASGLSLRNLSLEDLSPVTWYNQVNRTGHLFYAHAEKFYYDLRIVYEIESRFRNTQVGLDRQQAQPGKPKPAPGSTANVTGVQPINLAFEKLETFQSGIRESQGVQANEMRQPS